MTKREIRCGQAVPAVQAAQSSANSCSWDKKTGLYDAARLWQSCFGDSDAYTRFYFEHRATCNRIELYYDDASLAAMLHRNPCTLRAKGRLLTAEYLVGVATAPAYRRRGLMRSLMTEALQEMYAQKTEFCFLRPAKEAYYTPFGFRTLQKLWLPYVQEPCFAAWVREEETKGRTLLSWQNLKQRERKALVGCGNRLLGEQAELFTELTEAYLEERNKEMQSEGGAVYGLFESEEPLGLLMTMKEENAVYLVNCILPEIPHSFQNDDLRKENMGLMFRIIHMERFLQGLRAKKPEQFSLIVRDECLTGNTGSYQVSVGTEHTVVKKSPCKDKELLQRALSPEECAPLFFGETARTFGYQRLHIYDIV